MWLYAKLCFGRALKRSLSAHLMQVKLLLFTFYLNRRLHAVSIRKPSDRMSDFWTVRFLKTESEQKFGFPHNPTTNPYSCPVLIRPTRRCHDLKQSTYNDNGEVGYDLAPFRGSYPGVGRSTLRQSAIKSDSLDYALKLERSASSVGDLQHGTDFTSY